MSTSIDNTNGRQVTAIPMTAPAIERAPEASPLDALLAKVPDRMVANELQRMMEKPRLDPFAFEPTTYKELEVDAQRQFDSRLLPDNIKNWQAASVIMQRGREFGLTSGQSFQFIYVVNNRPSMSAQGMLALVLRSKLASNLELRELTNERCVFFAKRKDGTTKGVETTWTIEDAKKAELTGKDTWKKFPRRMLWSRAVSDTLKSEFPDVIGGLVLPDEAEEEDRNTPPPPSTERPIGIDAVKTAIAKAAESTPAANTAEPAADTSTEEFRAIGEELAAIVGRARSEELYRNTVGSLKGKNTPALRSPLLAAWRGVLAAEKAKAAAQPGPSPQQIMEEARGGAADAIGADGEPNEKEP